MHRALLLFAFSALELTFSACAGSNPVTPSVASQAALSSTPQAAFAAPQPFSPASSLAELREVALPQAAVDDLDAESVHPQSKSNGKFFSIGTKIDTKLPNTALFAVHTAYSATQLSLAYPAGGGGAPERLIAPAMSPTNACLTSDTVYVNYGGKGSGIGGGPQSFYRTVDSCTPGLPKNGIVLTPIDATFAASYIRLDAGTTPVYVTEIFSPDAFGAAKGRWYAILYNFTTGHWDVVRKSVGNSAANSPNPAYDQGYATFIAGPCPPITPIYARNIEEYDTLHKVFAPATTANSQVDVPGGTDIINGGPNSAACFRADSTGPASYALTFPSPNNTWLLQTPNVPIPNPHTP